MASLSTAPGVLGPIRPAQFLGAKTRSLPVLGEVLSEELPEGAAVADLFSGSSLVSQGLARTGHRVAAFDALEHCTQFARALLGVGRTNYESAPRIVLEPDLPQQTSWEPWLQLERDAIRDDDAEAHFEIFRSLPQIWRPEGASSKLATLFSQLMPGSLGAGSLVATHYGGTYLGLEQALDVDRIRQAIYMAVAAGGIDEWEESMLITALLSAASECAFSAGKHYAQPHRIREGKDLGFVRRRILEDRRKNLCALFETRLEELFHHALPDSGNSAEALTLEELVREPAPLEGVEAIYADPPYTAQQYSRFYHVPEVISAYRVPTLQRIDGAVTRGIYPIPAERHHSRFCSRREAPAAFADLCELAASSDALLCVSYSFSQNGETGNRRSIEMSDLQTIVSDHFSQVEVREIPVTYRRFNAAAASVTERTDAEVLLVAKNQ